MARVWKARALAVLAFGIVIAFKNYVIVIGQTAKPVLVVVNKNGSDQVARDLNKDLQDMAATERAFAATAVKEGFRDSFIKFFADDGIGFGPHPQRTREVLMKTPPSTQPRTVIFNWQPMFGDISLAGDIGYTTGPVLFTDITANPKPPWHGMYFSVWQKQADGTWKVVVDMGADMPQAVAGTDVAFTPSNGRDAITTSAAADLAYMNLDTQFSAEIEKHGMAKAYLSELDDEFRLHRSGHMPIMTKEVLTKYFEGRSQKFAYKTLGGKIAKSNDLAFTYGSFMFTPVLIGAESSVAGYYVHVWRKNRSGHWKLVADVINELAKNNRNEI